MPQPTAEHPDPRQEMLDGPLNVAAWPIPTRTQFPVRARTAQEEDESAPPSWWHGDEEASQSFLRAMGVTLGGGPDVGTD